MFDAAADAECRSAPRVRSGPQAAAGPARTAQVVLLAYLNPRDLRTRSLLEVLDRLAGQPPQGFSLRLEVIDVTCASARLEEVRLLAVPTILRVRPRPPVRVIGWFDSPGALARALQLPVAF